jgi:putative holliday junction resolvase
MVWPRPLLYASFELRGFVWYQSASQSCEERLLLYNSDHLPWPNHGRLASIDFGTVRIGIAICDPSRTWTGPLDTYTRRNEVMDRDYFQRLADRESITGWVIGLPIHCDGNESQKSKEVRDFADWLSTWTNLPYRFFDERFTTRLANRLLGAAELTRKKKKAKIDRVAAHLILEGYLEADRHGSNAPPQGLD